MFDESQRGHLKFWLSELEEVAVLVEVVIVVVQEGDGEGEDGAGGVSRSRPPPAPPPPLLLMEIFVSPAIRLAVAAPKSSWIIFIF